MVFLHFFVLNSDLLSNNGFDSFSTPVVTRTSSPGGGRESGDTDGRPRKLVSIVTIISISFGGPLAAETLGRPLGVRGSGAGVGSNSGSVGSESVSVGVVETVVSVEGFGFSGPLGPGESPDGLADVAGSTVGVGGESLFGFFSGSFADTLGRSVGIRDTTSSMSSNTTSKTIVTIRVVKAIVSIVWFRFSGTLSTGS